MPSSENGLRIRVLETQGALCKHCRMANTTACQPSGCIDVAVKASMLLFIYGVYGVVLILIHDFREF